jgi:hypothetical protein
MFFISSPQMLSNQAPVESQSFSTMKFRSVRGRSLTALDGSFTARIKTSASDTCDSITIIDGTYTVSVSTEIGFGFAFSIIVPI